MMCRIVPTDRSTRGPRPATSRRALALAALVLPLGGCYVYRPVVATPMRGQTVALALTDAGRLAMGPSIGEGARTLEGVVQSADDTSLVLGMRSITYINGQANRWTGEPLALRRQYVMDVRERQLSRSRTLLAAAVVGGGVVAFIASRVLGGGGSESERPGTGGPPANASRAP